MAKTKNIFFKLRKKSSINRKALGFTLIELLVVISIIALLASVVLVALSGARAKSRDARRVADINQFAKAMELYFSDYNTYPTVQGAIFGFTADPVIGQPPLVPTYLSSLPNPPTPKDGTCNAAVNTPGSNDYYIYQTTQSVTSTYYVTFCLGDKTGALSAGPHTLTQGGIQ